MIIESVFKAESQCIVCKEGYYQKLAPGVRLFNAHISFFNVAISSDVSFVICNHCLETIYLELDNLLKGV